MVLVFFFYIIIASIFRYFFIDLRCLVHIKNYIKNVHTAAKSVISHVFDIF